MDVIDTLSGIAAGSRLDELRAHRPAAREQAQATYDALFSPIDDSAMSLVERQAIAAFVAALFDVPAAEQHYTRLLADADPAIAAAVTEAVELGRGAGPYGSFGGELVAESQAGPELILPPHLADAQGARLVAALQHAHLLALHPRDSARERSRPTKSAMDDVRDQGHKGARHLETRAPWPRDRRRCPTSIPPTRSATASPRLLRNAMKPRPAAGNALTPQTAPAHHAPSTGNPNDPTPAEASTSDQSERTPT